MHCRVGAGNQAWALWATTSTVTAEPAPSTLLGVTQLFLFLPSPPAQSLFEFLTPFVEHTDLAPEPSLKLCAAIFSSGHRKPLSPSDACDHVGCCGLHRMAPELPSCMMDLTARSLSTCLLSTRPPVWGAFRAHTSQQPRAF